ncbi:acyl carrier protein [Sulfurospirillum barnesii]|uniref:Acyl carrier protein n=1 Tax=Sulfurospirillum barnesii (strain ATCC 700032 / DSM 10660 / SES-3) TaxID=760154 RepID=I3XYX2_SULBS|nr:acyl carrier protein [Sulfurospirillum barnesii]AFL69146.1 acyl carrier protein [Sulfurospirillum barnesii SES-3]
MENNQKFIELIAGCLEDISVESISMETNLDDLEGFDSLATLSMSAAINIEYGVNLSGLDINECETIGEVFDLVQKGL